MIRLEQELSFSRIDVEVREVGGDFLATISGGDQPHIGCAVLAVPRPSLTGDGSVSSTSSVLNVIGHKDEAICRLLAEAICTETGTVTVCTGGFHVDHLSREQIGEVQTAMDNVLQDVVMKLRNTERELEEL